MLKIALLVVFASLYGTVEPRAHKNYETIPTGGQYVTSKYNFEKYNYVLFEVKSCESAYLRVDRFMPADVIKRVRGHFRPNYIVVMNLHSSEHRTFLVEQPPPEKDKEHLSQTVVQTPGPLLDCDDYVKLYLRWAANGRVELGNEKRVILQLEDPHFASRKSTGKYVRVSNWPGKTGKWRIFNPKLEGADCCEDGGNTYCVVPDMGGRFYTQVDTPGLHQTFLNICKPKTVFDTDICNCNWPKI